MERKISGGKNNSVLSEREIGMKLRKAFILDHYKVHKEGISLYGRVLKDLKTGDILYIQEYADFGKSYSFFIEKITAYRHELDEISEGMTCELIVSGEELHFKEDLLLYVEE